MTILYIFPHPDDESFGPAPVIARQKREGHRVYLLTLTRGGATKQRHQYGYSVEVMGNVRFREMQNVAQVLNLDGMEVLDLPDGGLKEMDPLGLEEIIRQHVLRVQPDVLVSYAVHGISGHPDHLVAHAVVKRVFCQLRHLKEACPRRLALFTLSEAQATRSSQPLRFSEDAAIDCAIPISEEDLERGAEALACYTTYAEVIEAHRPLDQLGARVHFELFGEEPDPLLEDLFDALPEQQFGSIGVGS